MNDKVTEFDAAQVKDQVSKIYGRIASQRGGNVRLDGFGPDAVDAGAVARSIGYSVEELESIPEGANLGVGCGNPSSIVDLRSGETVLDLGAGAGFDCFVAANAVGSTGQVIGVDLTPEMVEKAWQGASRAGYTNVEFRLGDIEALPVDDERVDVVLSNCAIDLAPNKDKVFQEAFRVLKPGGRLAVSDTLRTRELGDDLSALLGPYLACLPGGIMREDYLRLIHVAGFRNIEIVDETTFPVELVFEAEFVDMMIEDGVVPRAVLDQVAQSVVSIKLRAVKPEKPEKTI